MLIFYAISGCLLAAFVVLFMTPLYWLSLGLAVGFWGMYWLNRQPTWGLMAIMFMVPFEALFAEAKYFTGVKLIGYGMIAIAFLYLMQRRVIYELIFVGVWKYVIALFIVGLVGAYFSYYPIVSFDFLRKLLTSVFLFFVTLIFAHKMDFRLLSKLVVLSIAITAVVTILSNGGEFEMDNRTAGLLSDPNYYALLIVFVIPFLVFIIFEQKLLIIKGMLAGVLLLLVYTLMMTFSRSSFLVLGFVGMLGFIHYRRYLKPVPPHFAGLVLVGAIVSSGVIVAVLPDSFVERMSTLAAVTKGASGNEDRSLGRRTSYIVVGRQMLSNDPLFGSGPGMFPVDYARSSFSISFSVSKDNPELYRRAHNTYLEVFAEMGMLGGIAFVAVVVTGLRNYYRARKISGRFDDRSETDLITTYGLSYLVFCIFMLFLSATYHKYLWIMLGFSYVMLYQQQSKLIQENQDRQGGKASDDADI